MHLFSGYPEGESRSIALPEAFFKDLLPRLDHLGELKVLLWAFWQLELTQGAFPFLLREDFIRNTTALAGVAQDRQQAEQLLEQGLERAVQRGALLQTALELDGELRQLYFLNSPRGRAAVQAIADGHWRQTGGAQTPVELQLDKPNLFKLYEENIGPITPMIAETLRDAEKTYPINEIEQAIRIAVNNNVRNWRYIAAVLERRKDKRKGEPKDRQDAEKARRRYAEWENPPAARRK